MIAANTVDALRLPWGEWALDRTTAVELACYLERAQPRTVLESGSGSSTVVLAAYARSTGATVVSLEHQPRYAARTTALLTERALTGVVDLRCVPLVETPTPMRLSRPARWYDTALPDGVDLAVVDGPPGAVGRHGALPALLPHMAAGGWQVWLDDAARPGEVECLTGWAGHYPIRYRTVDLPRPVAVIEPCDAAGVPRVDASPVAVTILTGQRPDLLARTVASVDTAAPGLLDTAHVCVLHNGGDPATAALLDRWEWIDERITHAGPLLPTGAAVSRLMERLARTRRQFWLHLEDDWQAATCHPGWWADALAALDAPGIGQVRLRHAAEEVRGRHMVTGVPIRWRPDGPGRLRAAAHYTLNPSLMRMDNAVRVWPASTERQAMERFMRCGGDVVQLQPGVFSHIGGGGRSLSGHR